MLGTITERKEKLAYSVEELSEKTTLSKAFLRNEIRAGRLKAKHFGRRLLIPAESWKQYSEDAKAVA